jgi:hypothetical protein
MSISKRLLPMTVRFAGLCANSRIGTPAFCTRCAVEAI